MVDNLSPETRRKAMQTIRSKGTKLENKISKELWHLGLRFRRNATDLHGKPDISIKKRKVVIFIDSCFWHGCDIHYRIPETNQEYWFKKINRNRQRDAEITKYYQEKGWRILRIWEHEIKNDPNGIVDRIYRFLKPNH